MGKQTVWWSKVAHRDSFIPYLSPHTPLTLTHSRRFACYPHHAAMDSNADIDHLAKSLLFRFVSHHPSPLVQTNSCLQSSVSNPRRSEKNSSSSRISNLTSSTLISVSSTTTRHVVHPCDCMAIW
ncbi:hypothetical protein EDB86DRAFT_2849359 [Lactarius hatsudake]|nr:hypothetical protein EDB86DRAFT_2849359 [Lactarius hatsudake]